MIYTRLWRRCVLVPPDRREAIEAAAQDVVACFETFPLVFEVQCRRLRALEAALALPVSEREELTEEDVERAAEAAWESMRTRSRVRSYLHCEYDAGPFDAVEPETRAGWLVDTRAALESAREKLSRGGCARMSERLREAAEIAARELRQQASSWITVAPILEAHIYEPTESDHVWNAYTRWARGSQAMNAAAKFRAALAASEPEEEA